MLLTIKVLFYEIYQYLCYNEVNIQNYKIYILLNLEDCTLFEYQELR